MLRVKSVEWEQYGLFLKVLLCWGEDEAPVDGDEDIQKRILWATKGIRRHSSRLVSDRKSGTTSCTLGFEGTELDNSPTPGFWI